MPKYLIIDSNKRMRFSQKIDRAVENPKRSLGSLSESAADFNYLKRQKESIEKVDQLIEEAEQSLKELRKEFYQNTLQDMSNFTQKVSQSGVTVSKSKIGQTNSVEVTSSLYKLLRLSRVKRDDAASSGNAVQLASSEIEYFEGAQSVCCQSAGLRKKLPCNIEKMPSDAKEMPSVTKKTSSLPKKTYGNTKKSHSATKKSYTDTKKSSETVSSGGAKNVLVDEAEADCKTDDLEVEMVNVNLLPDKTSMTKESKTKSSQPADDRRAVTLKYDVQLDRYSAQSSQKEGKEVTNTERSANMSNTSEITGDDIDLPASKFLGVKNSIFLPGHSVSEADLSAPEIGIVRRGSLKISLAPTIEIPASPSPTVEHIEKVASQQGDYESVHHVPIVTEKESDQNRSPNAPEDLAETDASESLPTSMEEMPNDSNEILNYAEETSPRISDRNARNEPAPRTTGLCCECSSNSDNNVPSANIDKEVDGDCSCKAEMEMLISSPCYSILTSRLKSSGSTRKAPKKTTFCTECHTFNSGEVEREKTNRGKLKDIIPDEPPQSTDVDTDDSYLNTISERTEPTSAAISQECVPNKPKQLTVQHLPQISIKPPLIIQKVFEIEIKPTGSVQMQIPVIQNIRYDEVLHAEGDDDVINPVLMKDVGKDEAEKVVDLLVDRSMTNISLDDGTEEKTPGDSINDILTEKHPVNDGGSHILKIDDDLFMIGQRSSHKPHVSGESETNIENVSPDAEETINSEQVDEKSYSLYTKDDDKSANEQTESSLPKDESKLKSSLVSSKSDSASKMGKKASVTIKARTCNEQPRPSAMSKSSLVLKPSLKNIIHIDTNPDVHPSIQLYRNPCGCEEGVDRHTDAVGLILDQALDRKCKCHQHRDSVGLLELKKSLQEVDKIAEELNQSLSGRLLAEASESSKKLSFKLLDDGELPGESGTVDLDVDQKEEEIREYSEHDSPINQQHSSDNNSDETRPGLVDTPPLRKISDMKELKEGMSSNENYDYSQGSPEITDRRNTPLFTSDLNQPDPSKLPKSISEFFDEPEISSIDENDREPLSEISNMEDVEKMEGSLASPLATDQLVKNILCELDKDLDDLGDTSKQIIAVNCQCICKKDTKRPVEIIPPIVESSNTRKPATNLRSSSAQKLKERKKRKSETSDIGKPSSRTKATRKSSQSSKKSSSGSTPPPVFSAYVVPNNSERTKPMSSQQSSHSTIRKGGIQHLTKDVVDPNVKESLMGAFDLSEQASAYEVPSRISALYKKTPLASPRRSARCSPVENSPTPTDDPLTSQSEESVYVLTHDVSTQISLESVQSERRQSVASSRPDKKAPRVTISINHDDLKVRGSMNGYSKKHKRVDSKDQNQQISQDNIDIIVSPSLSEMVTEQKTVTNLETNKTVVLQPVMVYYESKGVQKSLEDWADPPVKLHKMATCNDVESTSTNETDYESLPCRNAPCGDIPTSSEFLPMNSIRVLNRNYDLDEPASPSPTHHLKIYRSPKYNYASSSTDTTDSKLEESISEGEIKCRCSISAGELHICCPKNGSKVRTAYLKRHPEALVRLEYPSDNVHLLRHRKLYENWVTYYTSKTSTTNGSDTTDVSTDT